MKLKFSILLIALSLCFGTQMQAQNCPYDNTFYVDLTPASAGASANDACIFGGDLITVSVVLGETYVFSTCPSTTIDVTMTLYNTAGTVILATDDDGCGPVGGPSTITWVATFTGVANLLVDEFPCAHATNCIDLTVTWVAPAGPCAADAGTNQVLLNSTPSASPLILCKGDCADIFTDSNFVLPTAVPGEQAELMYALYTATPNLAVEPNVDPNFSGLFWTGDDFSDCNDPASIIMGAGVGNDIWLVPITMDDGDNNGNPNAAINYDNNLDSCWAMGTPINIVFLDSITGVGSQSCASTTATITLSGGYPGYSGTGTYTVVNAGPGAMVQSGAQGQTLTFTGYTPGQTLTITVSNDGNSCIGTITYVTPTCGSCPANAGTQTVLVNGVAATSPLILCKDDCIDILTDSNFVLPTPVVGELAELMYAVYTGTPNLAIDPALDPNYTGSLWTGDAISDCNNPGGVLANVGLPNNIWLVPITVDDGDDNANPNGLIHYDNNGDSCYALGTPIELVFLEFITDTVIETCSQTTFVLNGGYPGFNGGASYTVTNTGPGTMVQSGPQGDTIVITGYTPGQIVSITVTDDGNNCTAIFNHKTISLPTVTVDSIISVTCNGGNDGGVYLSSLGDTLPCVYTLDMQDSWGDGWNGGFLYAYVDGELVGNYAAAGTGSSATITVPHGQTLDLVYTAGAFEDENTYNLDLGATTLFTDGPFPAVGTAFTTTCVGTTPITYTYLWSNGPVTVDNPGLSQGSYTLTVTEPGGCELVSGPHVVNEPPALTGVITIDTVVACLNGSAGDIHVNASGGTPYTVMQANGTGYTYSWTNGSVDTSSMGLSAGPQCVTITDSLGCTFVTCVTLTEPSGVTASLVSSVSVSCNGDATGSATVMGAGGTPPGYTYLWSGNTGGQTTATATGLSANVSYSVTVRDAYYCPDSVINITISEPTAITVTIDSTTNTVCSGTSGAVYMTATGGTGAYGYLWSNAEITEDITGLVASSYVVTVTDANSCTATNSAIVNNTAAGTISFTTVNASCAGNDGCVYATVSGSSGSLGYLWSNGATTDSICGLGAGTYTLTVTDTIGAPVALLDTVYFETFQGVHGWNLASSTGPSGATPNVWEVNDSEGGVAPPGCGVGGNGDQTLHITCTSLFCGSLITGAVYNATQITNTRAESPVFSTVGSSNITFTFDYIANGEGLNDNASLWYNDGIGGWQLLDPSLKTALCGVQGQWTAYSVTLPASCDNNPTVQLGFNWTNNGDNVGTDPSIAVNNVLLTAMGTGTGGSVCTIINDTTITGSTPIAGVITIDTVVACLNGSAGDIHVVASGGTPFTVMQANGTGYTYTWTNGSVDTSSMSLSAGPQCVTITDSLGCTEVVCITLTEPSGVTASLVSSVSVSCFGDSTGTATVMGAGGTPPGYTYLWSSNTGGQTTATATGLTANVSYSVTVRDAYYCPDSVINIILTEPNALAMSVDSISPVVCPGSGNGAIDISVSGGTGAYGYNWSNGSVSQDITGLADSTYYVTVTDANGCTTMDSMVVATVGFIQIVVDSAMNVGCNGDSTGAIYTTATGDTSTSTCFFNQVALNEIMYRPILSNGVDPNTGEYIELIGPPGANIGCYILTDGDWTITIPPGTTIPADGIFTIGNDTVWGAGTFDLDAESCGCFTEGTGGSALLILTDGGEYVALFDGAGTFIEGVIYGSPSAGNTPSGQVISTLGMGGCASFVTIPNPPSFQTSLAGFANGTSIIKDPDGSGVWGPQVGGSLNACNVSGAGSTGNGTVTYIWSNGATTQDISGLGAGTYDVTATNAYGCSATASYTITEPAVLALSTNAVNIACAGDTSGMIDLSITGGTMPYAFNWSNGATTEDLMALLAGSYCVTVTDSSGCMAMICDTIEEPFFNILVDTFYICPGDSVQIQVNTNASIINWTPSATLNNDTIPNPMASPGTTTTYIVSASVSAGSCVMMDSVVVIVEPIDVNLATASNVLCNGDSTGNITTTIAGGNVNYLWNTGDTTANLSNLGAGTYMLTVSNTGSCTDTLMVTITEPATALSVSPLSSVNVTCNNGADGEVSVTPTGGTAGYTYLWSNNATTQTNSGLVAGAYIVTVTDANGCTEQLSMVITEPTAIQVQYNITNVSCGGTNDGSINITPSGGMPGYTYIWDANAGSQTTLVATGLVSNTYSVTVTDSDGCFSIANGIFVGPSSPIDSNDVPLAVITGVLDCDLNPIGALGINTTNTYTYLWSNGATTQNATGLDAGAYMVTITNSLGCVYVQSGTITSPFVPDVNPWIVSLGQGVATANTGEMVNIDGGNNQSGLGVSYLWTGNAAVIFGNDMNHSTNAYSNNSGSYVLTLTATASDSTACVDTGSVVLNVENVFEGIPNAFTPGNDDNINNLFRPIGLSANDIIKFRVFNRWGQEVYNGDELENDGWDGTFMGVPQPSEVYLYLLEYNLGGTTKVNKGEVTLIR